MQEKDKTLDVNKAKKRQTGIEPATLQNTQALNLSLYIRHSLAGTLRDE